MLIIPLNLDSVLLFLHNSKLAYLGATQSLTYVIHVFYVKTLFSSPNWPYRLAVCKAENVDGD